MSLIFVIFKFQRLIASDCSSNVQSVVLVQPKYICQSYYYTIQCLRTLELSIILVCWPA
jgi:hypothetical protein